MEIRMRENRKKAIAGFVGFLAFMAVCTLVAKSVYAYRLPMVSTCQPESKYIEHKVEAEGIVIPGGEKTVTYQPGVRIASVLVHVGDRVEEGGELFRIDLEDLEEIMEEKKNEISQLSLQIDAILENQEIARQKKELELARAREDYDITARLQDTQIGRAMESYVQAEEDLGEEGDQEELRSALQSAAYGEADARAERDEAVKQAGRKVEDLLLPEEISVELDRLNLEKSQHSAKLGEYQKIFEDQGIVTAPFGGVVTEILAGPGERVPDTAVLLLSDDTLPCQLKVLLDQEQKKYIGLGDQVSIKMERKSRELEEEIAYLAESRSAPEKYEALIDLPEKTGTPGEAGTISKSQRGEKYKCCLPMEAIHTENDRSYVYVMKEREGILGEEYYIEEMNVKVIDKNDHWAAIEEGRLDKESRIILSSTGEMKRGDTVRWEGENTK